MALVFCDGFEIDFADNSAGLWTTYSSPAGTIYYVNTQARTGNGSLRVFATNTSTGRAWVSRTTPSLAEIYIGFGIYIAGSTTLVAGASTNTVGCLQLLSTTGVNQVALGIDATTRKLRVLRGNTSGTTLGNGVNGLDSDRWHYIELRVVISDTVGVVQVRANGVMEIDLSSVDTNNAGGGDVAAVFLGITAGNSNAGSAADFYYDDFVVLDTTGSVGNAWPDGAGILMLNPAGAGHHNDWTVTGDSAWEAIDDVATYGNLPDGDTTKIASSTDGHRTSVVMGDLVYGGTIHGVQVALNAKADTPGDDKITPFVRIGSTDYNLTAVQPGTGYSWLTQAVTLSPATSGEWEETEINNAELGFLVS